MLGYGSYGGLTSWASLALRSNGGMAVKCRGFRVNWEKQVDTSGWAAPALAYKLVAWGTIDILGRLSGEQFSTPLDGSFNGIKALNNLAAVEGMDLHTLCSMQPFLLAFSLYTMAHQMLHLLHASTCNM